MEEYEQELKSTKKGREILTLVMLHVDEVSRLVNHNREVMVTWQRNKGTGFDTNAVMKKEIDGVSLDALIRRMAVVLQDYGSKALSEIIDEYLLTILIYAEKCDSLHELFRKIRQHE
jgi:hypothetical protein